MAKKKYRYAVGICGPRVLYKTIYAENALEAARIRYSEEFDSFSKERQEGLISYFEEQETEQELKAIEALEKQLKYQLLKEEDYPQVENISFPETTLDAMGNNLKQGDIVAIVYHPRAYVFSTEVAVVKGKNGQFITTQLLGTDEEAKFKVGKDGVTFPKIVKIQKSFPVTDEDEKTDGIGHAIHVGDTVAVRRPIEAGGNTQKGFEKGGIVTRMSDKMVFYKNEEGKEKRKGFSSVVVY